MATTQSSSPSHSPQIRAKSTPAPAQTTSLVEQQLRLSVESPQLLAAIEILLPLAKEEYRQLSGPQIQQLRSTNSRADQERGGRLGHWHCSSRRRLVADQAMSSPASSLLSPA